ncbi:MAG: hypothetical protein RI947_996 [Candidatus Parcubacteria bacterium]|jgi:hypothetical protein
MLELSEWSVNIDDFDKQQLPREKIKFLLKFAILAPSTHNSQPWKFIINADSCEIYNDTSINIKEADPKGRDLYISFGCLVENLHIAASYYGVFDKVNYSINKRTNGVAVVHFKDLNGSKNVRNDSYRELLDAICKRITTRGIFKDTKVNDQTIEDINKLNLFPELTTHLISDSKQIEGLSKLTSQGLRIAYESKKFRKEMSQWFVTAISNRREGLPTYSLNMPFLLSLIFPTLVRFVNIGKKVSRLIYNTINSAPLVCIISSKGDDELIWLKTGQLAERIMLLTTSKGLKNSIFVASVEMGNLHKNVQKLIGTNEIPHFLFCIGYMDISTMPTPRQPLSQKIISSSVATK